VNLGRAIKTRKKLKRREKGDANGRCKRVSRNTLGLKMWGSRGK
jgi:hypothetical protein